MPNGLGEANDDQLAAMLVEVKQQGIQKRDILSHDEFRSIVANVRQHAD